MTNTRELSLVLARHNAIALGVLLGALAAVGLWIATAILLVRGGPDVGSNMALLGHYFPGYDVTWKGSFLGLFWAFVATFLLTAPAAWFYYRGVLNQIKRSTVTLSSEALSRHTARLGVRHFAVAFGLLTASTLFLATVGLLRSDPATRGTHLGLLANFLPGYDVTLLGAFLGFGYMFVIGSAVFAAVALLYNWFAIGEVPGSRWGEE